MTRGLGFLDTNILVYAFSNDVRSAMARSLLALRCVIGVQGLNEFANVARRKLGLSWAETNDALAALRTLCPVIVPLDLRIHEEGVRLAERYGFATYDALMVAAALRGRCRTLWSEDMQHGLLVDGKLRVADPFRPAD